MCPKDDPMSFLHWIILIGGGMLFATALYLIITGLKHRLSNKIRQQPIETATLNFLPAGTNLNNR
ncbi:hypothetical protein [Undibacterium oligocarboniphilum]|uniref:Uncharacterized protein n=1 Tax=Undibacterium oligocarboniphilum TaxID=666702 RepID=A0A850QIM5_9BURK|nr:hypothetical protein [Undibacterium oligocarboniphilum]MBC3871477.1 hypothetical protein [Undibacterium oligocarboniphilum]NVO78947.1 hypothetical protein [Undibacterium oligocarboniphilum]